MVGRPARLPLSYPCLMGRSWTLIGGHVACRGKRYIASQRSSTKQLPAPEEAKEYGQHSSLQAQFIMVVQSTAGVD